MTVYYVDNPILFVILFYDPIHYGTTLSDYTDAASEYNKQ